MSLCRKALMCLCILSLVPTITLAYQNSTIMCITNQTLQENITVYKDGNMTNLTLNTHCFNDCDNQTMQCQPPVYQQNLIIIGIIIVAGLVLYKVFG